ncbi:hypothetical protein ACPZ19_45990 [Amycolatopsis lurida]
MTRVVQLAGLFMVVSGLSGAIDRVASQPILGSVLNVFNRYLIPRIGFLAGFEVFANLSVAALGVGVVTMAGRSRSAR